MLQTNNRKHYDSCSDYCQIPKRDANEAAIASWEEQKQAPKQPRLKLTQPKLKEPSEDSSPVASRSRRALQRRKVVDSSSPALGAIGSSEAGLDLFSQPSLSRPQFEAILEERPELRVQVSQHSSFPQHLYPAVQQSQTQREAASPGAASHAPSAHTLQSPPITISSGNPSESPVSGSFPTSPAAHLREPLRKSGSPPSAFDTLPASSEVPGNATLLEEHHVDLRAQSTPSLGLRRGLAGPFVSDSYSGTDISWPTSKIVDSQADLTQRLSEPLKTQLPRGQLRQGLSHSQLDKTSEGKTSTPTSESRVDRQSDRRQVARPHSVPVRQSPRFQTQVSLLSDPLPAQSSESDASSRTYRRFLQVKIILC